jgi:subtilisin family serine protease
MERGRSAGAGGGPPDTTPLGQAVARAKVTSAEEDWIVLPMGVPSECASGLCASGAGGAGLWGMDAIKATMLWARLSGTVLPTHHTYRAGVIDTGAHFTHVELDGQLNQGDSLGFKRGSVVSAADTDGHGTHVSGTIAAKWSNGQQGGLAGVVGNAELVHCKFLHAGGGTTSDAVDCLDHLREKHGVLITNNSWGGGGFSQALLDAIKRVCAHKDGLVIVAAGNSGVNIAGGKRISPSFPSAYVNYDGAKCVLPVAATNSTGFLADFSNFGEGVPIAAPGVKIRSSVYAKSSNTMEAEWQGTSMAAPAVTGAALMLKNAFPDLSGMKIKELLVDSAKDRQVKLQSGRTLGGGLLDINAAYIKADDLHR